MNTPSIYSLISNNEQKLLRYLRGHHVQTTALVKTIEQCGEAFLREKSFLKWLESLPWIVRYSDTSYVIHAGIRPDRPINRQEKDHCIYIRTWNPKTKNFPWRCGSVLVWISLSVLITEASFSSFNKDLFRTPATWQGMGLSLGMRIGWWCSIWWNITSICGEQRNSRDQCQKSLWTELRKKAFIIYSCSLVYYQKNWRRLWPELGYYVRSCVSNESFYY